jgi:hypothetical protein
MSDVKQSRRVQLSPNARKDARRPYEAPVVEVTDAQELIEQLGTAASLVEGVGSAPLGNP